jgi:hypothetical protein
METLTHSRTKFPPSSTLSYTVRLICVSTSWAGNKFLSGALHSYPDDGLISMMNGARKTTLVHIRSHLSGWSPCPKKRDSWKFDKLQQSWAFRQRESMKSSLQCWMQWGVITMGAKTTEQHKMLHTGLTLSRASSPVWDIQRSVNKIITHNVTLDWKVVPMTWKHTSSPPHTHKKNPNSPSSKRIVATILWDAQGVLLVDFLPRDDAINEVMSLRHSK